MVQLSKLSLRAWSLKKKYHIITSRCAHRGSETIALPPPSNPARALKLARLPPQPPTRPLSLHLPPLNLFGREFFEAGVEFLHSSQKKRKRKRKSMWIHNEGKIGQNMERRLTSASAQSLQTLLSTLGPLFSLGVLPHDTPSPVLSLSIAFEESACVVTSCTCENEKNVIK
jgi:hypothetical protein